MRMQVPSLALLSGLRIWCCRELWCRLAATVPIQPLAWELPYTADVAVKKKKKKVKYFEINQGSERLVQLKQQNRSSCLGAVVNEYD